ncbi:MAG: hypothetical protein AMS18_00240 [Gemmatimonas sp. SG8_17]|nr:MAG: hypothetical protein AMS18_00240 [Gemmatimonas sp. SG8_17]
MTNLRDEIRDWGNTESGDGEWIEVTIERLERLLQDLELEAYIAGEVSFGPYTDGAADERIRAALAKQKEREDG